MWCCQCVPHVVPSRGVCLLDLTRGGYRCAQEGRDGTGKGDWTIRPATGKGDWAIRVRPGSRDGTGKGGASRPGSENRRAGI